VSVDSKRTLPCLGFNWKLPRGTMLEIISKRCSPVSGLLPSGGANYSNEPKMDYVSFDSKKLLPEKVDLEFRIEEIGNE
jgi:hypothetical protein